jgi:hypothetical protein
VAEDALRAAEERLAAEAWEEARGHLDQAPPPPY